MTGRWRSLASRAAAVAALAVAVALAAGCSGRAVVPQEPELAVVLDSPAEGGSHEG